LRIGPIEAIDGTPIVDVKPVLVRARMHSATKRWRSIET
jgi:tRNA (Thr-GGU) A37 N-methylase